MLKSTEIVLEQLIIGLLFMVIVVLFVWGNPLPLLHPGDDAFQTFFFGVLVIIAAYAAGIVVDRWSDTLLEQLERLIRIQVYLRKITYIELLMSTADSLPVEPSLRLEIRNKDGGIPDYHDYLRRRMRITRALTCLMPALFLALALFDYQCTSQEDVRWAAGGITFALYAIVLTYSIFFECTLKRILRRFDRLCVLGKYLVPKTHDIENLKNYVTIHKPKKRLNCEKIRIEIRFKDITNPATLGLILFIFFEIGLLYFLHGHHMQMDFVKILLLGGGVVVTCLVGWAWWRISKTFFTFLRHYNQFGREKESIRFFVQ